MSTKGFWVSAAVCATSSLGNLHSLDISFCVEDCFIQNLVVYIYIGFCVDLVSLQDLDVAHMAEEESDDSYSDGDDDAECAPEGPHDAPATAAPAAKAAPAPSEAVVNDGPRCERGMNQTSLSRRRDRAAVAVVAQLSVVGNQLFPPLRGTAAGRGKESIRANRQGVTASTAGVR